MAETGTVASIAQRIFHVLQKNHSSEGLTVEDIKRLARLEGIYAGKIYQALGKLMRQHEVRYQRSTTDRRKGTYFLVIQQEDELYHVKLNAYNIGVFFILLRCQNA